jgi:hypothetical protein
VVLCKTKLNVQNTRSSLWQKSKCLPAIQQTLSYLQINTAEQVNMGEQSEKFGLRIHEVLNLDRDSLMHGDAECTAYSPMRMPHPEKLG